MPMVFGRKGVLPDRPTLILIHGAGGSAGAFLAQINPLDRYFNVAALELPGHGNTAGPPLESVTAMAEYVKAAINTPPLSPPVFLLGVSMGGAVTLQCAMDFPELLSGIIVVNTGPRLGGDGSILKLLDADPDEARDIFARRLFSDNAPENHLRLSKEFLAQTPVDVLKTDLKAAAGFNPGDKLASIQIPALIICGLEDKLVLPDKCRSLARTLPNAHLLELPNVGHAAHIEAFKELNQAVVDFVTGLETGMMKGVSPE
jgi:pimeloyl-ACP methyl ester carboxylesterase